MIRSHNVKIKMIIYIYSSKIKNVVIFEEYTFFFHTMLLVLKKYIYNVISLLRIVYYVKYLTSLRQQF